jgi:hypothetical protein
MAGVIWDLFCENGCGCGTDYVEIGNARVESSGRGMMKRMYGRGMMKRMYGRGSSWGNASG